MTAEQADIAFTTHESARITVIKVFGPTITETTDGLMAAANAIQSTFGAPEGSKAIVTDVTRLEDNAYTITSSGGAHFDAVGNFVIAVVARLGWSREATVVAERLSSGATQWWSLGKDGQTPDWARIQGK